MKCNFEKILGKFLGKFDNIWKKFKSIEKNLGNFYKNFGKVLEKFYLNKLNWDVFLLEILEKSLKKFLNLRKSFK